MDESISNQQVANDCWLYVPSLTFCQSTLSMVNPVSLALAYLIQIMDTNFGKLLETGTDTMMIPYGIR